jgi:hypothetical protein
MPKAYSADMRGRVIAEVEGGASRRKAAEGFEGRRHRISLGRRPGTLASV